MQEPSQLVEHAAVYVPEQFDAPADTMNVTVDEQLDSVGAHAGGAVQFAEAWDSEMTVTVHVGHVAPNECALTHLQIVGSSVEQRRVSAAAVGGATAVVEESAVVTVALMPKHASVAARNFIVLTSESSRTAAALWKRIRDSRLSWRRS